MDARPTYL
uniref:Uncharacterized protein n=1 Tax=Anguilla anguilla TaxID=7936 RepID=A0A0E9XRX8_ANGAN